ncbi:MAG: hypothetical protein ACI4MS_05490 [Candidatus Coproplasma sp.]
MNRNAIINNKRLTVLLFCLISITLTFTGLAIFSLFKLNKYVGVSVGGGAIIICAVIALTFKKPSFITVIFANSLAVGIAISSMYSHFKFTPPLWQLALVAWGTVILFGIFCLLTKTALFAKHHIVCGILFLLIVLTAEILLTVFVSSYVFSFALFLFMSLASHVLCISAKAKDRNMLIRNLTLCSFTVLLLAIVIVVIIITEGDGAELAEAFFPDTPSSKSKTGSKFNPYNFETLE